MCSLLVSNRILHTILQGDWSSDVCSSDLVYPQLPNYRQPRLLHRNNRDGTFNEVSAQFGTVLAEARASRGVAFGDIDNDGDKCVRASCRDLVRSAIEANTIR